jgi:hypothetical protein
MAEWSKAHAWKVCVRKRTKSSNLFLSAKNLARGSNESRIQQGSAFVFCWTDSVTEQETRIAVT